MPREVWAGGWQAAVHVRPSQGWWEPNDNDAKCASWTIQNSLRETKMAFLGCTKGQESDMRGGQEAVGARMQTA